MVIKLPLYKPTPPTPPGKTWQAWRGVCFVARRAYLPAPLLSFMTFATISAAHSSHTLLYGDVTFNACNLTYQHAHTAPPPHCLTPPPKHATYWLPPYSDSTTLPFPLRMGQGLLCLPSRQKGCGSGWTGRVTRVLPVCVRWLCSWGGDRWWRRKSSMWHVPNRLTDFTGRNGCS